MSPIGSTADPITNDPARALKRHGASDEPIDVTAVLTAPALAAHRGTPPREQRAQAWHTHEQAWRRRWAVRIALGATLAMPAQAEARGHASGRGESAHGLALRPRGAQLTARLPLALHVATQDGRPVAALSVMRDWVQQANAALAPHGIEVYAADIDSLPDAHATLATARDRDRASALTRGRDVIHVFVVEEIDAPWHTSRGRTVQGLHWERGHADTEHANAFIAVRRDAPTSTLAHEVGHFLGLEHARSVDNVMCSCRTRDDVGFSRTQGALLRRSAREYLRTLRAQPVRYLHSHADLLNQASAPSDAPSDITAQAPTGTPAPGAPPNTPRPPGHRDPAPLQPRWPYDLPTLPWSRGR